MTSSEIATTLELERAIERYEEALGAIEDAAPDASTQQIVKVLLARDAVEEALPEKTKASEQKIAALVELDSRLQKQAQTFASNSALAKLRQSLKPPESAWWWFFEVPNQANPWDRFDWAWNGLTVACLVLAGTFATQTVKAMSQDGMDVLQTLGTISQGAGLVLVTGGALTDKGQQTVKNILTSLKIPPQFHAEATCAASVGLLLTTYGVHQSLPFVGDMYYQEATKKYDQGELSKALFLYEQANNFLPERPDINVGIGKIYESLGQFKEAKSYYQKGLMQGDPASLNGYGRVLLHAGTKSSDYIEAETYLQLALQRQNLNKPLKAEIHTHLGDALAKQASFPNLNPKKFQQLQAEAEENFQKAIALYSEIKKDTPEWGMAHCKMASFLQKTGKQQDAKVQWEACKNAKPETIAQYQMILQDGGEQIAEEIDTTKIVNEDSRLVREAAKAMEAEAKRSTAAPSSTEPVQNESLK